MAIQHYNAAVADLQVLLEQSEAGSSKEVAARLASAQAKQRNYGTLGPNHYVILGLEAGATAADVKAAYKYGIRDHCYGKLLHASVSGCLEGLVGSGIHG
jgi:hypothetical protein